jgi:hypothetical protein
MGGSARMSLAGGGAVVIPVETPYEYEVLFDYVADYTKSHGPVNLELNNRTWTVSAGAGRARVCSRCAQPLAQLTYSLRRRSFCPACVRRHEPLSDNEGAMAFGDIRKPAKRKEASWLSQTAARHRGPPRAGRPGKNTPRN